MFRIVYENERLSDSRNVLRKQTEGKRINLFWGGARYRQGGESCDDISYQEEYLLLQPRCVQEVRY